MLHSIQKLKKKCNTKLYNSLGQWGPRILAFLRFHTENKSIAIIAASFALTESEGDRPTVEESRQNLRGSIAYDIWQMRRTSQNCGFTGETLEIDFCSVTNFWKFCSFPSAKTHQTTLQCAASVHLWYWRSAMQNECAWTLAENYSHRTKLFFQRGDRSTLLTATCGGRHHGHGCNLAVLAIQTKCTSLSVQNGSV